MDITFLIHQKTYLNTLSQTKKHLTHKHTHTHIRTASHNTHAHYTHIFCRYTIYSLTILKQLYYNNKVILKQLYFNNIILL